MSIRKAVRPRAGSGARSRAAIAAVALLAAACRGDSMTMPAAGAQCGDAPGCRATPAAPLDPVVSQALDDARLRLVPALPNDAARPVLADELRELQTRLESGQSSEARMQLAMVYVQLDGIRLHGAAGYEYDGPDAAAIRLALVPVTNALGVTLR